MSGNLENDRSVTAGKMYPIDLAQKITIVKSVSNTEVKMTHLIPGQPKTTASGQIISHTGPVGMMRPAAAILSPSVSSQPQMIVSGSPILQGTQIVSQGSQMIGSNSQIISQSQMINPSCQILSPGTQIISQGTQLSAQVSNTSNTGSNNVQVTVPSSVSGQVLSVGGLVSSAQGLVSGAGNLVVSSSVRTLPPSVRVLPPQSHHSNRPVHVNVNVSSSGGVLVSKGVTSHVPRGLAAGASLAVRPVTPAASAQVGAWASSGRGRGAVVYGPRAPPPRAPPPRAAPPAAAPPPHSAIVTLPATTVLTSSGVISGSLRAVTPTPRPVTPTPAPTAPRPLPLLQRNYQPAKVVGVASVGPRGVVGNSAPAQLYYEVPRAAAPPPRPLAPYAHAHQPQVSVVNTVQPIAEARPLPVSAASLTALPRPTILRKRETDGSPSKNASVGPPIYGREGTGWEDVHASVEGREGSGGSTTMSASSSPAPDDDPEPNRIDDVSPRKKPRKQMLTSEVRQCHEFQPEELPPTPPPVNSPPKRPQLSSTYVCGWRSTALHFTRPSDVRRREPRAKDILAIANQKHVLTSAEGWKVHHLTAQMDDLVSLEADVGTQLSGILKALEGAGGRALSALQPHTHNLLELIKGNIQRSKIVCEGIQEAREDILRVFTHRNFVSDILTRQADKRCFRKHRSQS
ncbi:histone deacetylase complex subunit SAP130 [Pectinophora gossypiella]|nr:histone deacetylase complex subunit SAP130 [Pectinophora gossypiella]